VAVSLAPVGEDALHIVQQIWALWMATELRRLPRRISGVDLGAQSLHLPMEFIELLLGFDVGAWRRLQVSDLPFDILNIFSGFGRGVHEWRMRLALRVRSRAVNNLDAATSAEVFRA